MITLFSILIFGFNLQYAHSSTCQEDYVKSNYTCDTKNFTQGFLDAPGVRLINNLNGAVKSSRHFHKDQGRLFALDNPPGTGGNPLKTISYKDALNRCETSIKYSYREYLCVKRDGRHISIKSGFQIFSIIDGSEQYNFKDLVGAHYPSFQRCLNSLKNARNGFVCVKVEDSYHPHDLANRRTLIGKPFESLEQCNDELFSY